MKTIKEAPTYQCDGCGEIFKDYFGNTGYADFDIWEVAYKEQWEEIDGKHYCPDCYEFDVDEENQCCINYRPKDENNRTD